MSSAKNKAAAAVVILLLVAGLAYLAFFTSSGQRQSTTSPRASTSSNISTTTYCPLFCQLSTSVSTSSRSTTSSSGGGQFDMGNWTTYHKDTSRSGYEPLGNVSTVTAGWNYSGLDGDAYAESLVYGQTVFVATENNSVYAINALDGSLIWRTNLGAPVQGGSLPCGDISPSGITGTPVIDTKTGTIYAVAFLNPPRHVLFGLDIQTGAVKSNMSADPQGMDPGVQQQRGALTLYHGVVYIPYGGLYGDCGQYHGYVAGAFVNGSGTLLSYTVPTNREGGIWATSGASVGPDGDLYVATGNGDSTTNFDHGDSVIQLSPSLQELSYFAPSNWAQLNGADIDVGSLGPTVLPNGDLFQAGKEGVGYLLSGSVLGGIGGQIYSSGVCGGAYGGTAHVGMAVFLPCTDGMVEIMVGNSNFTLGWKTSGFFSGSPVVTGSVVWAVDVDSGELLGYGLSSGAKLFDFSLGSVVHFCTPSVGDGKLFVAADMTLHSFDLGTTG